jgi:hypothetical protein
MRKLLRIVPPTNGRRRPLSSQQNVLVVSSPVAWAPSADMLCVHWASHVALIMCHCRVCFNVHLQVYRSNNAGLEPVTPAESVCAGVCQQALGFCTDKDGDGVIELGEGCLVVSGCCCSMLVACWSAGTCFGQPTVT